MRLDEDAFEEYTDQFIESALRYETLDHYDVASDDDGFARYMAGEPIHGDFGAPWHAWLRMQISAGRSPQRVRVLYGPPSSYLLFEFEWGYLGNIAAGESIRILDLTTQPRPPELVDEEFWLMDQARAAVMTYTPDGQFAHADTAEGADAAPYVAAARSAWDAGESFQAWWARNTQWHRDNWWPRTGARAS